MRIIRLPRHGASCPVAMAVSCSADRQALGKITADGVFLEQLETRPGALPARRRRRATSTATAVVHIDLNRPMDEIRAELQPATRCKTRVMLTGPMVVARDIAHAKIKERLDAGERHAAVPARPLRVLRRPGQDAGRAMPRARSARPPPGAWTATSTEFQAAGGSYRDARQGQPLAGRSPTRARRTAASTSARSAARRPGWRQDCITKVEVLEYPELGMEAVWKIEVRDFPAFIVVDDKGNDFFELVDRPLAGTPIQVK